MRSLKKIVCEEPYLFVIHLAERDSVPCFRRNFDRSVNYSRQLIVFAETILLIYRQTIYRQTASNVKKNKVKDCNRERSLHSFIFIFAAVRAVREIAKVIFDSI